MITIVSGRTYASRVKPIMILYPIVEKWPIGWKKSDETKNFLNTNIHPTDASRKIAPWKIAPDPNPKSNSNPSPGGIFFWRGGGWGNLPGSSFTRGNFPVAPADKALYKKIKFSIKYIFSKCDQIRSFLWIRSSLLKKFWMENFIFSVVKISAALTTRY